MVEGLDLGNCPRLQRAIKRVDQKSIYVVVKLSPDSPFSRGRTEELLELGSSPDWSSSR
jgi:hypothetical protein